jgi:tRNA-Thr(GGU) m(6)t(6)A37 methyltransferase TsaA
VSGVVPIGYVRSAYVELDQLPSQGLDNLDATGEVVVRDDLVDALLGLDRYEHLWLLTWLDSEPIASQPPPLQLVPRATEGTGEVQGVFASRAPRRPNPIGLSLVRNRGVHGNVVEFAGVDLLDGTPVLDIKPWFADSDNPTG